MTDDLIQAIENQDIDEVHRILDSGVDPNLHRDGNGKPAIGLAALMGDAALVEALLKAGADPNLLDNDGESPLILAVTGRGDPECVRLLVASQANINARGLGGATPLICASMTGRAKAVRALLELGADSSLRMDPGHTGEGQTARVMAEREGWDAIVKMLDEHHATTRLESALLSVAPDDQRMTSSPVDKDQSL